jgi:beta-N-acetylhexosaminidase
MAHRRPPGNRQYLKIASGAFTALWMVACAGSTPPPVLTEPVEGVGTANGEATADGAGELAAAADSALVEADTAAAVVAADTRSWAVRTLESLTLREKVGQLLMPWVLGDFAPEGSASHERVLRFIEDEGIGGVIMSVGTPTEVAAKLNDLQRHSKIPLLVGADLETGAGFRMNGTVHMPGIIDLGGATDFPALMALGAAGDPNLAYEMGRITAIEARAVGIHVPFAPVLDVNNNPNNPIINVRSFGGDAALVSEMGAAFIRGIQDYGAVATGKHFPGHGDTEVDSHIALPVIRHSRARMDSVELRPFQAAIDVGMGGIMTAHISVPSLTGGVSRPSTLSPAIITDMLREEMGFGGLIFTDAMDMSAIARGRTSAEAAVMAIEAGADVILMPASVTGAIDGIVAAVESGRISEERIDRSVARLLATKEALGLDVERTVPIEDVRKLVGTPEHIEIASQIAQKSITVMKNGGDLLPLLGTRAADVLSVTFGRPSDVFAGRTFDRTLRESYPRLRTVRLDVDSDEDDYADLLQRARRQSLVVVSTYVTAVSYSGSVAIPEELVRFINDLQDIGVPHVVISFGNPYLIEDFPNVQAYMLAWNGADVSQRAAAHALLGGFEIAGKVPTQIPPMFQIGDGVNIPNRERNAGDG